MDFVPSGSLVAFSNLYRAGNVSEFPKEGLQEVMIGMLVLTVAGYVGTIICHFASWVLPGFSGSPRFGWHNCVIIPKKLFVVEPRVTALQC